MMDMRYLGHAMQQYQDETKRKAQMPGVTRPSFRCATCGCSKGVSGRKRLSVGWRCADCEEALQARLARGRKKIAQGEVCADCQSKGVV